MSDLVSVIMAGGSGTRFWPLSTPDLPKQFVTAFEDRSLYRQSVERAFGFSEPDRVLVLGNAKYGGLIREQSPELPERNVVLEPRRRDTAAAIGLAAFVAEKLWPGCTMVVMPSDHRITDNAAFRDTVTIAAERAREGGLVTLGIRPTYPATCYGYLHLGGGAGGQAVSRLERFVEKPDIERARGFVDSGEYLWNAGIFVWKATAILDEIHRHLPSTHAALAPVADAVGTPDFDAAVARAFDTIDNPTSIDFGVMEKAEEVWAVPAAFDWSDVGGWIAAKDFVDADGEGNRIRGAVVSSECRDNLVIAETTRVVCVGVEGLVVVSTPEGTLVCREDLVESIKPQVERILKS